MRTACVTVTTTEGEMTLRELVTPSQLASEHFRTCLAERIGWAVEDAADEPPADGAYDDASWRPTTKS